MIVSTEEAMNLLNLSLSSIPQCQEEESLLLELVEEWLYVHGEDWVRSNCLLWYEWEEKRRLLRESK